MATLFLSANTSRSGLTTTRPDETSNGLLTTQPFPVRAHATTTVDNHWTATVDNHWTARENRLDPVTKQRLGKAMSPDVALDLVVSLVVRWTEETTGITLVRVPSIPQSAVVDQLSTFASDIGLIHVISGSGAHQRERIVRIQRSARACVTCDDGP